MSVAGRKPLESDAGGPAVVRRSSFSKRGRHGFASAPLPRMRLGARDIWDQLRALIRAWWVWLAVSLLLWNKGAWLGALLGGIASLALYYTSPRVHPAFYALERDIDAASTEFRMTMS